MFEISIPIRWGDMDAYGHVNNTVYFRYMEQARISWLMQIGISTEVKEHGPVLVNTSMEFLKPLHYPGDVICRLTAGTPGRSSFEMHAQLYRADDPVTLYAKGSAKVVWVDQATGKSMPIPELLRNALTAAASA
jgi:acyl-CoA thioester hydrolase